MQNLTRDQSPDVPFDHVALVFGAASRGADMQMVTGGCDCASTCACDPDLVTFNYADGKSAVDTNMTARG